jgi:DNA-binding transcriptional LysR family regulator
MQVGSMEATKEIVKLGLAISILAPWIARKEIERGELIALPLGKRKLRRRWGILHARGRRLSMAEETFLKECLAATAAVEPAAVESSSEPPDGRHDPAVPQWRGGAALRGPVVD